MDESAALRRAVGSASDGYSLSSDEVATVSKDDCVEGRLPRGTICAAIPGQMAVPERGSGKIAPEKHAGAIRFFYEKAKERMLRTSAEVPRDEYRNVKPYMDPALRVKGILLRALLYVYMAGMVAFCSTVQKTVSLFTVVKKYDENGVCVQRIVWDLRLVISDSFQHLGGPWGPWRRSPIWTPRSYGRGGTGWSPFPATSRAGSTPSLGAHRSSSSLSWRGCLLWSW